MESGLVPGLERGARGLCPAPAYQVVLADHSLPRWEVRFNVLWDSLGLYWGAGLLGLQIPLNQGIEPR